MSPLLPHLGAVAGGGVVVLTSVSVVATLVVPRRRRDRLAILVDAVVDSLFRALTRRPRDFLARDHRLSSQAAVTILVQLIVWLLLFQLGCALLLWPLDPDGFRSALQQAGSSMFTLGYADPTGATAVVVDDLAAGCGLVVVALQVGYLPTLYGAFNRRETEVTLLLSRAGAPSWGPELLARTRFGFDDGDEAAVLREFYLQWERWAADVTESHSNYAVMTRFRSPAAYGSWLVGLLAVMDSAALYLSVDPEASPAMEARLVIRMGSTCLRTILHTLGEPTDDEPDPDGDVALTYEEFLAGLERMRESCFPMSRSTEQAWRDFCGWRVNYETVAYRLAWKLDAVPALWSGPRRHGDPPMPPVRRDDRRRSR